MISQLLLAAALGAAAPAASPTPSATTCAKASAFVGTICTPASSGTHPAVILLDGIIPGDSLSLIAPRFAAAGYVAASVAYFGAPGLPPRLENVPVEPVGAALNVIRARSDVDPNRIAIFGISTGGEIALLAASAYSQVRAVVVVVGSPFAWQSIPRGLETTRRPSWTFEGKPVPFVPHTALMGEEIAQAYSTQAPLDLRQAYDASMRQNASAIPSAMIHLENVHGPVFFLAADDDRIWDSETQSQIGMQYLKAHHHPYADQYAHFPNAGHIFLFSTPQLPMTQLPVGPVTLLLGGTPAGNVQAGARAWPQIFKFLASALRIP